MYDLILADPPWPHYGDPNKDAAAGKHYDLLTREQVEALPVAGLCNRKAALFLWATGPTLHMAVDAIRAWGFHYRGVAFIWVKTRKDGGIIHGQGIRPTFTKPNAEYVLAASTCKTGRPLPLQTEAMGQIVLAPRGRHSQKPAVFHERLEELFGDVPRIELFARQRREGWEATGLELDGTDYRAGQLWPTH